MKRKQVCLLRMRRNAGGVMFQRTPMENTKKESNGTPSGWLRGILFDGGKKVEDEDGHES